MHRLLYKNIRSFQNKLLYKSAQPVVFINFRRRDDDRSRHSRRRRSRSRSPVIHRRAFSSTLEGSLSGSNGLPDVSALPPKISTTSTCPGAFFTRACIKKVPMQSHVVIRSCSGTLSSALLPKSQCREDSQRARRSVSPAVLLEEVPCPSSPSCSKPTMSAPMPDRSIPQSSECASTVCLRF